MKYKAVIFDLFGTLVDIYSRQEYENALVEMASILNAPYDEFYTIWLQTGEKRATGVFRTLEENLKYVCHELEISVTGHQIRLAKQVRFDSMARVMAPRKDAKKVVSHLKSDGYKIGLVSNCSHEVPILWHDIPFAPFFDAAVFSSVVGIQKPDPRIYQLVIKRLAVKPENCLYIGDGDSNELTGALKVGMTPVLIRNPDEVRTEVQRIDWEGDVWRGAVISSLKEVLNLLK